MLTYCCQQLYAILEILIIEGGDKMISVYVYVLDTMADWETGFITAELNSARFFKKNAEHVSLKTVSCSKDRIKTMGGISITPDCLIDDISVNEKTVLILPGADSWNDEKHTKIIKKANEILSSNGTVCAICGATVALANCGLLNNRPHTSNGIGFLEMFAPNYTGQSIYIDTPAVADHNLITASCTGSLLWAKLILKHLNVLTNNTLECWYKYFCTGKAEDYFALMQSLQH